MYILSSLCEDASFLSVLLFAKKITEIISIIIPSILVLLLTIDFVQGVMGDEEKMQKVKSIAIKRIIYALLIFFVPIIVDTAMTLLENKNMLKSDCYTNATDENISKLIDKQDARDRKREAEIQKKIAEREKKYKADQKRIAENAKKIAKNRKTGSSADSKTVRDAKVFSKKKVLDTLNKSNLKKSATVVSSASNMPAQSMVIVGNYYVVAHTSHDDKHAYVVVYDKRTGKKINSFNTMLGHANGMTYNPKTNTIYAIYSRGLNKVYSFSANNLGTKKSLDVNKRTIYYGVSGAAYDDVTGKTYISSGKYVYEWNPKKRTKIGFKKVLKKVSYKKGKSQDIAAHNGIIYVLNIIGGNFIDMYRASDGAYLGSYKIDKKEVPYEIESMSYYGSGNKFAILFNNKGNKKNYIYVTDDIVPRT